jgi:hypothetical protein
LSLYADYLHETSQKHILEREWGFATYHIRGTECYIEDIFITVDRRKSKSASELAQHIETIAKAKGCKFLTGSVNTAIKDPTTSIKVLLAYGFKFLRSETSIIWFCKDL